MRRGALPALTPASLGGARGFPDSVTAPRGGGGWGPSPSARSWPRTAVPTHGSAAAFSGQARVPQSPPAHVWALGDPGRSFRLRPCSRLTFQALRRALFTLERPVVQFTPRFSRLPRRQVTRGALRGPLSPAVGPPGNHTCDDAPPDSTGSALGLSDRGSKSGSKDSRCRRRRSAGWEDACPPVSRWKVDWGADTVPHLPSQILRGPVLPEPQSSSWFPDRTASPVVSLVLVALVTVGT